MKKNCCYDCPRRTSECHAYCEDYLAFRAQRDRELAERDRKADYSRGTIVLNAKQRAVALKAIVPTRI